MANSPIDSTGETARLSRPAAQKMHRPAGKKKSPIIFNCIFRCSKTGKNGKLFIENGLCEIHDSGLTMTALTIAWP
jgi:hypothetical protein